MFDFYLAFKALGFFKYFLINTFGCEAMVKGFNSLFNLTVKDNQKYLTLFLGCGSDMPSCGGVIKSPRKLNWSLCQQLQLLFYCFNCGPFIITNQHSCLGGYGLIGCLNFHPPVKELWHTRLVLKDFLKLAFIYSFISAQLYVSSGLPSTSDSLFWQIPTKQSALVDQTTANNLGGRKALRGIVYMKPHEEVSLSFQQEDLYF